MQVQALQQFLSQIVPLAKAAGASETVTRELGITVECLEPFKEVSLADFNQFLRMAEECIRTNKFPEPPKKPVRRTGATAPKITVAQAAQKFLSLKERATDPTLEHHTIDAEIDTFAGLTAPQLKELAAQVNAPLPATAKAKPKMIAELKRHIKELKESRDFNQHRPMGSPSVTGATK